MLRTIQFLLVVLIFNSHLTGQNFVEVRDLLSNQMNELNGGNSRSVVGLEDIRNKMADAFSNKFISSKDGDKLIADYNNIIKLTKENVKIDSLKNVFYSFYLNFSQILISEFSKEVFKSTGNKILFFGTSVSCPCTMELCVEQIQDVLKAAKEKGAAYLVVDSFLESNLITKYKIEFYPTILLLDSKNSEAVRYTRDKDFYGKLVNQF